MASWHPDPLHRGEPQLPHPQHAHGEDWQLPGWEMTHLLVNALHPSNDPPSAIPPQYGIEAPFLGFGPTSSFLPNSMGHPLPHPPLVSHTPLHPTFLPPSVNSTNPQPLAAHTSSALTSSVPNASQYVLFKHLFGADTLIKNPKRLSEFLLFPFCYYKR